METRLADWIKGTPQGDSANDILRACVHCGFCNATCPTYQLLGDELDGPRGRIYQIKQVLEGAPATRLTQQHLDRCLTCRNCETTCASCVARCPARCGLKSAPAAMPAPGHAPVIRAKCCCSRVAHSHRCCLQSI